MKKGVAGLRMDPAKPGNPPMPLDGRRMVFDGFVPVLEARA